MLLSLIGVIKTILIIIGIFAILKWWGRKRLQQQSTQKKTVVKRPNEKKIKFNDQHSDIEDADYEEL